SAKSSAVATQQWNSYELTLGKCTSKGITITSSGNALGHFIPNNPSQPQPPPSTDQPTNEEPTPNVVSSSHQKTQTPRQALNKVPRSHRGSIAQTRSKRVPTPSYDSPLLRVHTPGSDEERFEQHKLTGNVQQQSNDLPLSRGHILRSDEKDPSKQGRSMIEEIDQDARVTLVQIDDEDQGRFDDETDFDAGFYKVQVTPTHVSAQREAHSQEDQPEDQLGVLSVAKVLADATRKNVQTYTRRRRAVSTGSGRISTTSRLFSTSEESVSTVGASMQLVLLVWFKKFTFLHQLHSKIKEEWENIRARVKADKELTQRLRAKESNKYSEVDQQKMLIDLINQRKRYFNAQKANEKRNKPMTQAQQRTYMSKYIKNMGSYIPTWLKKLSFDEIKELFKITMKRVNSFVPMETEVRGRPSELAPGSSQATITDYAEVGSSKRVVEAELDYEGSKTQNTNEASWPVREQPDEEENELSQKDLQQMMMVVPVEEVYVEALQVKNPIIDWEVYTKESRKY
nr:hypothetical protein [Tanacetum cinerariifolium]